MLAVYVTSHGFGHLNRTAAVLNRVPARRAGDDQVALESLRALARAADAGRRSSSVCLGCGGGQSARRQCRHRRTRRRLELASRCHAEAMARLDDEVARLREQGTAAVLCDAPAVPLVAARRAEVPGFLMSNFTWADIYAPHARAVGTAKRPAWSLSCEPAYRQATATFRIEPAMSMSWLLGPRSMSAWSSTRDATAAPSFAG